mgnify:CR=1 FL=1
MEKYIEIINIVVPKHSDRTILIKQLDKIQSNPEDYIDNNDRLLDLSDDYLWLGLIDLLITKGYAFEIDWKDDYSTAKDGINKLLSNWQLKDEMSDDDLYDKDAEKFFPIVNSLLSNTNCQLFNMDIDSDSYVSTMVNIGNEEKLLDMDNRISKY